PGHGTRRCASTARRRSRARRVRPSPASTRSVQSRRRAVTGSGERRDACLTFTGVDAFRAEQASRLSPEPVTAVALLGLLGAALVAATCWALLRYGVS